eukprot:TRINITY_DN4909_c0_g1_i3.p1 TRINITY_DN4909_c0_g1~~TRINITY_DN4909_c0_g1_i3.p1  ORF type:complete len:457 (+),score=97.28 TRINITY_DN4909_c0_g1_i3:99-1373(+)
MAGNGRRTAQRPPSRTGSAVASVVSDASAPAVVLLGAGVWRSDNERSRCASCNESFSMTRRRHHCRACGDIFCHKCSSWQADLEDASGRPLKSQRVCLSCQQELAEDRGTPLWHAVGRMRYFYALKHRGIDANALGGMSESERRNALADARVDPLDFEAVAARVAALSDDARILSGIDAAAPLPSAAAASQQPQSRLRAISQRVSASVTQGIRGSVSPGDRGSWGIGSLMGGARPEASRGNLERLNRQLLELASRRDELQRRCDLEEKHAKERVQARQDLDWIRTRQRERREREVIHRAETKLAMHLQAEELKQRREDFLQGTHHASLCWGCETEFTATRREHHCRECYQAVCNSCSRSRNAAGQRRCDMCLALSVVLGDGVLQQAQEDSDFREHWAGICEATAEVLDPTDLKIEMPPVAQDAP